MPYVRAILSAVAAVMVTEFLTLWWVLRPSSSQATEIDLIGAIFKASLVWPVPWLLAISLFAIFFAASRLHNTALSISLFWFPTLTVTCLAFTITSVVAYLAIRFKNS